MENGKNPSFCFAAAGWMKVWYYGVGKAFQERVDLSNVSFAGSSAGSLVSVCLLCGVNFDDLMDFTIKCVERCRTELRGPFKLRQFIDECFDEMYKESYLPLCQDRLNVYVTDLPIFKPRVISKFRTHEELKFWVANSCNIPYFVGWPERADQYLDDEKYVWVFDGGASKFCPVLDESSITVSAFGKADIRPSRAIPLQHGLYPPPPGVMRDYYALGYRDANRWLSNAAYSSSLSSSTSSMSSSLFSSLSMSLSPSRDTLSSPPSTPPSSPPSSPPNSSSSPPSSPPSSSFLSSEEPPKQPQPTNLNSFTSLPAITTLPSLTSLPSFSSLPPISALPSMPSLSFSSSNPPPPPPTPVRHKLRIGKELIPPPMERRRDFLIPQLARSVWEITLLFFSIWVLFPFLFICTGLEKLLSFIYMNIMLAVSFAAHVALLCQNKTLSSHVTHYQKNSKETLFEMLDPRLFLGSLFPALSRHIGTRHLTHEEFVNMSFVYRYFQDTWLLKRYKNYRKEADAKEEEKVFEGGLMGEKVEEKVQEGMGEEVEFARCCSPTPVEDNLSSPPVAAN